MQTPPLLSRCFSLKRQFFSNKLEAIAANAILLAALASVAFANGPVTITTANLPNAVVDSHYSGTVNATGGCSPYKWKIVSGSLPPGLTGQPSPSFKSYTISGTPTQAGNDTFQLGVQGCGGHVSKNTYTVQVQEVATNAVDLEWNPSNSPDITGYNVYRSAISGGPYSKVNTGGLVAGTVYADTTIAPGSTYYYVTTSVNSSNQESGYSNQVQAVIP